jgi:mRNA interferase HigB
MYGFNIIVSEDAKKNLKNSRYIFLLKSNSRFGNYLYICKKKLRVIAKKILREFWEVHSDSEQQLKSWYKETRQAEWKNPNEIKEEYPSASILNNNRLVFNIKVNNYRLIVKISFEYEMVWIRFIGTHAEYDKINANTI